MQGCRGHNCDADNREIHEAVPSAAVVAPLTFGTYFSLAGNANIDDNEVDSQQASHRHQNIISYFSDEDDGSSSPSGGE
jgi:hypothetical protein